MDVEFLDAWSRWDTSRLSVYHTFSRLLSAIPHVRCLRIRVAEISGVRSGWGKFSCVHDTIYGIRMGGRLEKAFDVYKPAQLRELVNLEIDGFRDIWPLLKLAPSLETLKMCLSGGFPQYVNVRLIQALRNVSTLKHLSYTPTTLRIRRGVHRAIPHEYFSDEFVTEQEADRFASLELVLLLGKFLPHLETLDLQTRFFRGKEISFLAAEELIPLKVSYCGKFDFLLFQEVDLCVSHISGSRRDDHGDEEPPVNQAPVICVHRRRFSCTAYPSNGAPHCIGTSGC